MAWEALNNIADSDTPIVIVVNDNGRSYSPTIGGMAHHLDTLRTSRGYEQFLTWINRTLVRRGFPGKAAIMALRGLKRGIKDMVAPQGLFEDLGIKYIGPINGHDIFEIERALTNAKAYRRPVIVHAITEKGRGYEPAERHVADKFHNIVPIHPETGLPMAEARFGWSAVFSDELVQVATEHPEVVAITAAMLEPVGFAQFAKKFPQRIFDVGIAEQHAVTAAAGMAHVGLHPVVAVYATFLNRAFDQVLMDVGLHRAGVTFVLDRAGVTGDDGASHNGMWDFTMLRIVPGIKIAAPRDETTLRSALRDAVAVTDAPTVIRFPKGELPNPIPALESFEEVDFLYRSGNDGAPKLLLVGIGAMVPTMIAVAELIAADHPQFAIDVVTSTWVWPVPPALVKLGVDYQLVVTLEDGLAAGGIGSGLEEAAAAAGSYGRHLNLGIPTEFLGHATREQIFTQLALTPAEIATQIVARLSE
jgi:1-deoxy-D-xylulose-5-phosphate synthase